MFEKKVVHDTLVNQFIIIIILFEKNHLLNDVWKDRCLEISPKNHIKQICHKILYRMTGECLAWGRFYLYFFIPVC